MTSNLFISFVLSEKNWSYLNANLKKEKEWNDWRHPPLECKQLFHFPPIGIWKGFKNFLSRPCSSTAIWKYKRFIPFDLRKLLTCQFRAKKNWSKIAKLLDLISFSWLAGMQNPIHLFSLLLLIWWCWWTGGGDGAGAQISNLAPDLFESSGDWCRAKTCENVFGKTIFFNSEIIQLPNKHLYGWIFQLNPPKFDSNSTKKFSRNTLNISSVFLLNKNWPVPSLHLSFGRKSS